MKLSQKQINLINKQKIVVLSTVGKDGYPRPIFVEVNKVTGDKIIITNNEMKQTYQNLLVNNKVFVLAFSKNYSHILKIEGKAIHKIKGKNFKFVKSLKTNIGYKTKGAVVMKIEKVT